jgi:imidazolonepropionase-like amidohydrolase
LNGDVERDDGTDRLTCSSRSRTRSSSRPRPEIRRRGIRALPDGDYGFPNNPIGRNARDPQLFVDLLGHSPVETLTAATRLGGQLMGMGDELGMR